MIEKKMITVEDGLSFATNQNNLLLQIKGLGGSDDYASSMPPPAPIIATTPPVKNPNSFLDMIE